MEDNERNKTCCFFGHRKIVETNELRNKLYKTIEELISYKDVNTFLFGSRSQFDNLCYDIVTELKRKYPYVKRIYVRAEFPHINEKFRQYLLEEYENTYYPQKIFHAGKAVYVERNYEMINSSAYCVCYYDKSYILPRINHRNLSAYQPKSGTKVAYEYAIKNGNQLINILEI